MSIQNRQYDVIIIGAGIGGLVCGCYLAKAGKRVLIAEQHFKPGGYCTTFKRKNFTFDAAAHCFGGYRNNGITRKIFEQIGINTKLKVIKANPSNIVVTPDYKIAFSNDIDQTAAEFEKNFPHEHKNVLKFLQFLTHSDAKELTKTRKATFKELLDSYFVDPKLKALIAAPLLGIGGLPPSLMSAFVGAKLYSEFLLDGGYHFDGGMQELPATLAETFKHLGGDLLLSSRVTKIVVKNNSVTGVLLGNRKDFVSSKNVVANCDAYQTFCELLSEVDNPSNNLFPDLKKLTPSISNFILYLGLDNNYPKLPCRAATICCFSHYDLEKSYSAIENGDLNSYGGYMCYIPDREPLSLLAVIPAPFKSRVFWEKEKESVSLAFVSKIEESLMPDLSKYIIFREAATPQTLFRYTLNQQGACFGWAATSSQLLALSSKKNFMDGLYLTGHWTTQGMGISSVAYIGAETAKFILKKKKSRTLDFL